AAAHHKARSERDKVELKRPRHVVALGDAVAPLPPALVETKQAIAFIRQGKTKDATALAQSIDDPAAAKLVQWARMRQADSQAGFDRYAAFIADNPDWPSIPLLRRRAEARLWQERRDADT